MNTIELKKSTLGMYKGLGLSSLEIAEKYGITEKEVRNAMETFELVKRRITAKTKEVPYTIKLVDDTADLVIKTPVASSVHAEMTA